MIKTLQKKFVISAMTAITVLILFLLGAINIFNFILTDRQTDSILATVSRLEGIPHVSEHPPRFFEPRDERDTFMASTFFTVRFDKNNEIIGTDLSRIASIDEQEAKALATEALEKGAMGKINWFKYRTFQTKGGQGTITVFLDTTEQLYAALRILLLSASIGLVCWLLMLLLVMLLSKRAIRPVAANIEKQRMFVTNAGHEIKTPLAIIMSNVDAMELYHGENKWSRNIKEQTVRLNGLMKNLLLLSRCDEVQTKLIFSQFSLSDLVHDTLDSFAEPFELKGITVIKNITPSVSVTADKESILQLILILLDNALKYTDDSGKIEVILQSKDTGAKLQIKNTCEALPDTSPDKLFDRFYRGDLARTQKSGGYGIGLSVAQAIAQSNKAEISASYEENNTVNFTFKI